MAQLSSPPRIFKEINPNFLDTKHDDIDQRNEFQLTVEVITQETWRASA